MNVQGINNYPKQNFTAQLVPSNSVMELTKHEVLEGRFNAYKKALENLGETHKITKLDIISTSDGKGYIVKNLTNKEIGTIDYAANLTDAVNELARPTSKLHKDVFKCTGSDETYRISNEFYA